MRPFCFHKDLLTTHIYGNSTKNISPCPDIIAKFGDKPNPSKILDYIKPRFSVLKNNLVNICDRKTYEAIAITIQKPKLNAQVLHRKVSIIQYYVEMSPCGSKKVSFPQSFVYAVRNFKFLQISPFLFFVKIVFSAVEMLFTPDDAVRRKLAKRLFIVTNNK